MAELPKDNREFCYYCDKEIVDDNWVLRPIKIIHSGESIDVTRKFHYDCFPEFMCGLKSKEHKHAYATGWDEVYRYFQDNLYSPTANGGRGNNKIREYYVNRLLGLKVGRYMPTYVNTRITKQGYSFDTILNTMKICKPIIEQRKKVIKFNDDKHEINYIISVLASHIGSVDKSMKKNQENMQRVEKIRKEDMEYHGAEYKRKGTGKRKVKLIRE